MTMKPILLFIFLFNFIILFSQITVITEDNKHSIKSNAIFLEDFEAWPPSGWTIFDIDSNITAQNWQQYLPGSYSSYVATIPYLQNDTINEWLISPSIFLPSVQPNHTIKLSFDWNTSFYWAVDPYDYFDVLLKISTDNGLSWQILWMEGDSNNVVNSGIAWPYDDNWSWHHSAINLNNFSGQTIKIAFFYSSLNGGATFLLDNVAIEDFDYSYFDVKVHGNNFIYPETPLSQAEYYFSGNAKNNGAAVTDSLYVFTKIPGTGFMDSILLSNPFPMGASENFSFTSPFIPNHPENYSAIFQIPYSGDSITTNNADTIFFTVTDSVYARDFNSFYGSIGLTGQTGFIGSIFHIVQSDTMTSVSLFWHPSFDNTPGDLFSISLFQWNESLNSLSNEIFTSETFSKTAAMMDSTWITYNTNDVVLLPGYYMVGINCLETNNIFLAVDTTQITNSNLYIKFENGYEFLTSDYGNILLRMNLGHSILLSGNKIAINQGVNIYPNPSKGILFIDNCPQQPLRIQIFDLQGKILIDKNINATRKIDISSLESGSYIVRIFTKSNNYFERIILIK